MCVCVCVFVCVCVCARVFSVYECICMHVCVCVLARVVCVDLCIDTATTGEEGTTGSTDTTAATASFFTLKHQHYHCSLLVYTETSALPLPSSCLHRHISSSAVRQLILSCRLH